MSAVTQHPIGFRRSQSEAQCTAPPPCDFIQSRVYSPYPSHMMAHHPSLVRGFRDTVWLPAQRGASLIPLQRGGRAASSSATQ
ncbi:unnamed protein product [Arctogadus glacialis]